MECEIRAGTRVSSHPHTHTRARARAAAAAATSLDGAEAFAACWRRQHDALARLVLDALRRFGMHDRDQRILHRLFAYVMPQEVRDTRPGFPQRRRRRGMVPDA